VLHAEGGCDSAVAARVGSAWKSSMNVLTGNGSR